ncbi:mitochondrial 37S ribosomal protein mS45 Ecym_8215 [Eremothecium cymbalariae DBVPG|uniref:37S ribosomal protein S35, mitochondrial n=1 Tax=Eremothecium cymbalariae (strain CBS 270.75 / DBVPG 7215 / KCTC 17166 / NRRL Y-17582) TaxID=931890 RepID=G8JXC6_ERECY|nr:Hypothetical protein Ecym_8215 [Eremothecium cymbalariae DBVPG\
MVAFGFGSSALECSSKPVVQQLLRQQVRYASRRNSAYPSYPFKTLRPDHKSRHDSNFKYAMRQFLGPKNFKGEYAYNRYFAVPDNHEPKYISPEIERGESLVDPLTGKKVTMNSDESIQVTGQVVRENQGFRRFQPFPQNRHCTTNYILDEETRKTIYHMIQVEKKSAQDVSRTFNLKIPRIEAVVKLIEIEQKMEKYKQNRISPEQKKMAETMYKMFPIFEARNQENLSEIPVPAKALSSRILTLAESEPFGPIDAANVLELEPAAETLNKLAQEGEHSTGHTSEQNIRKQKVIYGEVLKGERFKYKFTNKSVGKVGFRYGSSNRDNKKDRGIGFDERGRMVYL